MKNKNRIVCVIMGQDCENTIDMCLESVKTADAIVFCDGGSTDNTLDMVLEFCRNQKPDDKIDIIKNKFIQKDKLAISKQKNYWLNYLKENYKDYWCLYLDSDEIVDDFSAYRKLLDEHDWEDNDTFNPRMRHLIGNLCHEDSTKPIHFVPIRVFKITNDKFFPDAEHCILSAKELKNYNFHNGVIWHMGYVGGVWDVKKRYDGQMLRHLKDVSHEKDFLNNWSRAHLFGMYPVTKLNPIELPEIILNKFSIDKDEIYFANRGLEVKHSLMVKQWNDYFNPESVLDLGCGRGCYLYFWKWYVNKSLGIEISEWAIKNAFTSGMIIGDISNEKKYIGCEADLITAIDVLEHLSDEDLDKTLTNISKYGKKFLFSIPFIGDPNLEADSTHIQKKTKEEWIKLIESYGIEIKETPKDWSFYEQILIGRKNDEKNI